LACSVKGLRVRLNVGQQQQQHRTASCCAWLRRHAYQVVALVVIGDGAAEILAALAEVASSRAGTAAAAAAAAGEGTGNGGGDGSDGGWLPLQQLVVADADLLHPEVCQPTLWPLLGALPHLQLLRLPLIEGAAWSSPQEASTAAVAALAPLRSSTSLTKLAIRVAATSAEAQQQLMGNLPPTLQDLVWCLPSLDDPEQLSFDHLTGLTRLVVQDPVRRISTAVEGYDFSALRQLRQLHLIDVPISDAGLLCCKEQLVSLTLRRSTHVLNQLTNLETLDVAPWSPATTKELLQQAPGLCSLALRLTSPTTTGWERIWELQHYSGLAGLRDLAVTVQAYQAAPMALWSLTQLQRLTLDFHYLHRDCVGSWAWAVAGLVNLEVLSVPAVLTCCSHPWLTRLTRLGVLQVECNAWKPSCGGLFNVHDAAVHISRVLRPDLGCLPVVTSSDASSSHGSAGAHNQAQGMVVCIPGCPGQLGSAAAELKRAVLAAVGVLPPNRYLYEGPWQHLMMRGTELWPGPMAAQHQLW
jgi:hypothetical protein